MASRSAEAAVRSGRAGFRAFRRVKTGSLRRGGILFEILLSIALFAGAAAFALGTVRSAFDKLDQTRRKQQAIDLARSKIAQLEAGLISLTDLREGARTGEVSGSIGGSFDETMNDASGAGAESGSGWVFDVQVHRSEFAELSLIELTVSEQLPGGPADADYTGLHYTLRQLVKLRESDAAEYEDDPLNQVDRESATEVGERP